MSKPVGQIWESGDLGQKCPADGHMERPSSGSCPKAAKSMIGFPVHQMQGPNDSILLSILTLIIPHLGSITGNPEPPHVETLSDVDFHIWYIFSKMLWRWMLCWSHWTIVKRFSKWVTIGFFHWIVLRCQTPLLHQAWAWNDGWFREDGQTHPNLLYRIIVCGHSRQPWLIRS